MNSSKVSKLASIMELGIVHELYTLGIVNGSFIRRWEMYQYVSLLHSTGVKKSRAVIAAAEHFGVSERKIWMAISFYNS